MASTHKSTFQQKHIPLAPYIKDWSYWTPFVNRSRISPWFSKPKAQDHVEWWMILNTVSFQKVQSVFRCFFRCQITWMFLDFTKWLPPRINKCPLKRESFEKDISSSSHEISDAKVLVLGRAWEGNHSNISLFTQFRKWIKKCCVNGKSTYPPP